MSMLHTYQGIYEILADATVDVAALDGSTAGVTLDIHDLPSRANGTLTIGPEANGCEIIACSPHDGTDNANANFKLYGWSGNGPAEYIADVSCTIGTARINDVTTALYVDTMVIAEQQHLGNLTIKDSANNRVAKLWLGDIYGYKNITCRWYDVSGVYRAYMRWW